MVHLYIPIECDILVCYLILKCGKMSACPAKIIIAVNEIHSIANT